MESDVRTELLARLAERGLALKSSDHQVLTLRYDPEKDSAAQQGQAVDAEALSRYARNAILDLPRGDTLFPRLQDIAVEASPTD
jgi:hypothetical protein